MTAKQFMEELKVDFAYQSMDRERDRRLKKLEAEDAREEQDVVEALRRIRPQLRSVWELVNTSEPYPELVPTLLEHLQREYTPGVREGIARALAVRESRGGWRTLVDEYLAAPGMRGPNEVKYAIGLALSAAADHSVCDELNALTRNRRNGQSRMALLPGVMRLLREEARPLLEDLADDPALKVEAATLLRRLDRNRDRRRASTARRGK